MTCLDLFCKGQFVLNFSGGMPLSDSLSTFLTLIATAWLFYMYCLLPTKSRNMLVQGISKQRGQSNSTLVMVYNLIFADVLCCLWSWDRDIYIKFISFYLFEDFQAIYLQLKVKEKGIKNPKKFEKIFENSFVVCTFKLFFPICLLWDNLYVQSSLYLAAFT